MSQNIGETLKSAYSLNQDLHFFSRKYNQKYEYGDIKNIINKIQSKTGKDLGYIYYKLPNNTSKDIESKRFSIFDIMIATDKKDVPDISKLFIILNKTSKHTNKTVYDEKTIQYDFLEILSTYNTINDIYKEMDNNIVYIRGKISENFQQGLEDNPLKQQNKSNTNIKTKQPDGDSSHLDKLIDTLWDENETDNTLKNNGSDKQSLQEQIHEISDKLVFFKTIRDFYKHYNYVITYEEAVMIQDILDDIHHGKIVTLLGETGSGKTELARFICKAFLHKDPIDISGNKYLSDSDFTLEKIITSRSMTSNNTLVQEQKSGISKEEYLKEIVEGTFDDIVRSEDFKTELLKLNKESGQKNQENIKEVINKLDTLGYNLFTEHHLMGLFKGMYLGRPVIIDEANLIRPETFMALNDYLTKKIGDKIELPNGLGTFSIKEGFSIILTGNDPDASNKERYKLGRYSFDEATYNRLSIYIKNYYKQDDINYSDDTEYTTIDYLQDNQLYFIVLMMLFDHKHNPYGVEIQKDEFNKNYNTIKEKKEKIFDDLKNLAQATSLIQKAFLGKTISILKLNSDISAHNDISRKVLTMRNIKDILDGRIHGALPMQYYIYKHFIYGEGNEDEQYAIIALFHEKGFFDGLVSDDKQETIDTIKKWYLNQREPGLSKFGKEKNSRANPDTKVLINKFDLISHLFDNDSFNLTTEELEHLVDNSTIEDNKDIPTDTISTEEMREEIPDFLEYFANNYSSVQRYIIQQHAESLKNIRKEKIYVDAIKEIQDKRSYLEKLKNATTPNPHEIQKTEKQIKNLEKIFNEFIKKMSEQIKQYHNNYEEISKIIGFLEYHYSKKESKENTENIKEIDDTTIETIYECLSTFVLTSYKQ